MKNKKIHLAVIAVFVLLLLTYVIDPGRLDTLRCLERAGQHTPDATTLSSLNVTTIAQDTRQRIWIGTSAGLNVYDGHSYLQFFHSRQDTTALPDDYINAIHRDRAGGMWVATQNGLARYDGAYRFRRYTLPPDMGNVTRLTDDTATTDSTAVLALCGTQWMRLTKDSTTPQPAPAPRLKQPVAPTVIEDSLILQKPRELVTACYTDAMGDLWVGLHNAGYRVISPHIAAYRRANHNSLAAATSGKDITSLERVGSHILAGTTLRLYVYDTRTGLCADTRYSTLFNAAGASITSDDEERVTQQELNDIVACGEDGAWLVNDHSILTCRISGTSLTTLSHVCTAPSGHRLGTATRIGSTLYASSDGGYLVCQNFNIPDTTHLAVSSPWYGADTQTLLLADGRLLLFMRGMHLALLDPQTKKLTTLEPHGIDAATAEASSPAFALQDALGNVWLGTRRSGLFRLRLRQCAIERTTFLSDVHIQAMTEDSSHRLWITTLKDIVCYEPRTDAVFMHSLTAATPDAAPRQYFDLALCTAPSGDIVIGSSDGCHFMPQTTTKKDDDNTQLRLTALDIKKTNGELLTLNADMTDGASYTLAHNETALSLRFFYPNYDKASALMYQYMLEGYDHDWRTPGYKNTAYFAHLTPGRYTLRLRLVASPSLPPVAELTLHLRVKPAPWNCLAAWWLYIALAGYLVYYLNSLYLSSRTARLRLQQEKNEREREQRTNEMNMSFFANISHEFRNPITLIAGPLVALQKDTTLPPAAQRTLRLVGVSVNRMLRLIDQMLDFNQLETDALRLKVTQTDVKTELQRLADVFEETLRHRAITLQRTLEPADYNGWTDTDKLDKILSNLFTNALKHTPDGGRIRLTAHIEADGDDSRRTLRVSVFNSGSRIDTEKLPDVFKRYYQQPDTAGVHQYGWGTGIGLYYVKRLVGLHHGDITVCNEDNGVCFRFSLPLSRAAYADTERTDHEERVMQIPVMPERGDTQHAATEQGTAQRRTRLLIVDDDMDVAQYVRSLFADDYDVTNRYSAEAALEDMDTLRPDLIISDIIMGRMSGYDFCRTLKENLMYSHIPVILVTAKSNPDEQIRGLSLGAIAYVTKPFDPAYLHAIVDAQLRGVKALRQRLGENTDTTECSDALAPQDKKFMDDLYALMERRAAEQDLNVTTACRDLLISQSKFTYKLRELTGDTPGTFFRKYKLNRAAALLREGRHTIAEVALLTGFTSPAHFSVAFKKQFGTTPSDFLK